MSALSFTELDHIQAVLTARGYTSSPACPRVSGRLPAGNTLAIQFGERAVYGRHNVPQLPIQATFQINGDKEPSAGLLGLTVERIKTVHTSHTFQLALMIDLQIALEADFHLPDELIHGTSSIQDPSAYHHLRELMADARHTLVGMSVDPHRNDMSGPALRLEARLLNALSLGRTGFVRPCEQTVSPNYRRMALAGCDWLQKAVLPDLRLVMFDLFARLRHSANTLQLRSIATPCAVRSLRFLDRQDVSPEPETIQ